MENKIPGDNSFGIPKYINIGINICEMSDKTGVKEMILTIKQIVIKIGIA